MIYVIDTNVISAVRRSDRAPQVAAWFRSMDDADLFLSVITVGEIARGICQQETRNPGFAADLRRWLDQTLNLFGDRILQFGAEDARIWGRLSAEIGHGGADLMIAATTLARGGTLVTGNVADFRGTGVPLINPFQDFCA